MGAHCELAVRGVRAQCAPAAGALRTSFLRSAPSRLAQCASLKSSSAPVSSAQCAALRHGALALRLRWPAVRVPHGAVRGGCECGGFSRQRQVALRLDTMRRLVVPCLVVAVAELCDEGARNALVTKPSPIFFSLALATARPQHRGEALSTSSPPSPPEQVQQGPPPPSKPEPSPKAQAALPPSWPPTPTPGPSPEPSSPLLPPPPEPQPVLPPTPSSRQ